MAPRVRINLQGFKKVRQSDRVEQELKKQTDRIAAECNQSSGGGYVASVSKGRTRSRGSVVTGNAKAIRDNARNQTLVKKMRP